MAEVVWQCGRVVDVGGPTPLLARELVGRDGEIDRLREAWRARRIGARRSWAGRRRQEQVGPRARRVGGRAGRGRARRSGDRPRRRRCGRSGKRCSGRPRLGVRPAATWRRSSRRCRRSCPSGARPPSPRRSPGWCSGRPCSACWSRSPASGTATLVVEDLQWADLETLGRPRVPRRQRGRSARPARRHAARRRGRATDESWRTPWSSRRVASDVVLRPLAARRRRRHGSIVPRRTRAARSRGRRRAGVAQRGHPAARRGAALHRDRRRMGRRIADGGAGLGVDVGRAPTRGVAGAGSPAAVAAALLGRSFDWTLAARVADLDDHAAAEQFRRGVRVQLLDVDGSSFRFRHAPDPRCRARRHHAGRGGAARPPCAGRPRRRRRAPRR